MGVNLHEIMNLPEPLRTEQIKKLDNSETYTVHNTGDDFNFKYQGKVKTMKAGDNVLPIAFAVHVLDKFQPNEFDKDAHIVVDPSTLSKQDSKEATEATVVEIKAQLKEAKIDFKSNDNKDTLVGLLNKFEADKLRLQDEGVVIGDNPTGPEIDKLIKELDKQD